VSNKYREENHLTILRKDEYSKNDILTEHSGGSYVNPPVKVRFPHGDNFIEKIGFGVANLIDGAADKINDWALKL
jgi:hypothetical protein